MTDLAIFAAAGALGASAGVWLSLGATLGKHWLYRLYWAVIAAFMGLGFAFGVPAACVDSIRLDAPQEQPQGRYL